MKILVVGTPGQLEECRQKLGGHDYTLLSSYDALEKSLANQQVIFDFLIGDKPESYSAYPKRNIPLFLNTCKINLASMLRPPIGNSMEGGPVFGFNGFPTMFNREFLEIALGRKDDELALKRVCDELKTEYLLVEDRVGLVTPRVICMIINEAYYTVQEGTAAREDIDLAMKLGTNYPHGPFEWCAKIGLKNVYELLEALYDDTKDERYKISALMKKEYLLR
jgi:3-hydroxybutyryl-CoA dehydrogenase